MQRPFSMISSQAAMIASALMGFMALSCMFAKAHAFLTCANARISSGASLMVRPEIW
jgi:lipoprotein